MLSSRQRRSILCCTLLTAGPVAVGCGDEPNPASSDAGTTGGETSAPTGSTSDGPEPSSGEETGTETGSDETGEPVVCDGVEVGSTPLRRLTRQQYANAIRDILGQTPDVSSLDADEKAGPFNSNYSASVSPDAVEQYRALAETLAANAVGSLETLAPCAGPEDACTEAFVVSFGRRMFRRPLTADEVDRYVGLADQGEDYEDKIRLLVQAFAQSGNFLYHLEFGLPGAGDDVIPLTNYELASRLSFFLWDSTPDDSLLDSAEAGELGTVEGLREHAERLLEDSRARDAVGSFHLQWLALDHLDVAFKDPAYYPSFDAELAEAMMAETRRFSQIVVLQGDAKLETLLTANYSYLDGPLFELYGVEPPPGHNAGMPVPLDPNERSGLLTQAAFLTEHALPNASGPIQRGVEVRTNLLCDPPPPPPPGVNAVPPEIVDGTTTREIFEQHTADPACAGCHVFIDGIGLGFESYDGIGAFRTVENGMVVDDLGELNGTDVDGEFDGVVELAQKLAQSENVRECVSRQWFRFAFGRFESDEDLCSLDIMHQAFADSDYDIRELLITLVQTDAFRFKLEQ